MPGLASAQVPVIRLPLAFILLASAAACRVTAAQEVRLPMDGPTFRVQCHYEFANCQRQAEAACHGRYEAITRKNCPRCGKSVPATPEKNAPVLRPGYRGTLYYRCS